MGDLEHIYQGVAGEEDFLIVGFLAIAQPQCRSSVAGISNQGDLEYD